MNVAKTLARISAKIPVYGEVVTITRSGLVGSSPVTFTYPCLPQPLTAESIDRLQSEGLSNINSSQAHVFVMDGQSPVLPKDTISYNGSPYVVLKMTPTHLNGQVALWQAVATRRI